MTLLTAFKAYDVRGRIPTELNEDLAYKIGQSYVAFLKPKRVCVGRDIRLSSEQLCQALIRGLTDSGVDVYDIGLCGTEGVYFATFSGGFDGGIMVTASHNPPDYNGMKFVREQSKPISADTGLMDMARLIETGNLPPKAPVPGRVTSIDVSAGMVIDRLEPHLPFQFIKVHHEADGTFPNGVPNPMLEENRQPTIDAIKKHGADVGLAWDGDFDRCFFFDEHGTFIEGYYLVGLLAEVFLKREKGARIVHDPRLTWNTLDIVARNGGKAVLSKSGHAFIKQVMRECDAAYGGEMSAHHYFRDFAYADSGMIPWLIVLQVISETGKSLSDLVGERMRMFPASGEINRKLAPEKGGAKAVLAKAEAHYKTQAKSVDYTDGLSMEFDNWRFNMRASNTEPLVRLNVESRGDEALMQAKTKELLALMDA